MICPRCGRDIAQKFYGPCVSCRLNLRATVIAPPPDHTNYRRTEDASGKEFVAYIGSPVVLREDEDDNDILPDDPDT